MIAYDWTPDDVLKVAAGIIGMLLFVWFILMCIGAFDKD